MNYRNLTGRKELAVLGQFIILVLISSIFFKLQVIESENHGEDFHAITALASFTESPIHNILIKQYSSDDNFSRTFNLEVQSPFVSWLKQNNRPLDELRRQVRQSIIKWLKANGLAADDLADLSGKGYGEKYPFLFFDTSLAQFISP